MPGQTEDGNVVHSNQLFGPGYTRRHDSGSGVHLLRQTDRRQLSQGDDGKLIILLTKF